MQMNGTRRSVGCCCGGIVRGGKILLFSSNLFLFLFLPVILLLYYLLGRKLRNGVLLVASLAFYAWGEPKFVLVMIGSILCNYVAALLIAYVRKLVLKKLFLVLAIAGNLSILFVYKYLDFAIENLNAIGFSLPLQQIALPLGISFFTFQAMSYVIDVYRGTAQVQKYPWNIGLYISFFPQLVAGPIVRYTDIAEQIVCRKESFVDFSYGVKRFIIGFSKKILLANNMALLADRVFALPDAQRTVAYAWLGAIAYSFQILFDFSGYSDMAIGLGKMFGFHFLENFNYPYISRSISEFWRRWHMSLGQWFRDYVYFPLGGSRVKSRGRLIFNLFVVWFLTGVWHGANWNFILWGLMYFVLIAFEKITGIPERLDRIWKKEIYRIFTLVCVMLGWIFFRAETAQAAVNYCGTLLGNGGAGILGDNFIRDIKQYGAFLVAAVVCSTPLIKICGEKVMNSSRKSLIVATDIFSSASYMFLLFWSVACLMIGSHNPFIYFNF